MTHCTALMTHSTHIAQHSVHTCECVPASIASLSCIPLTLCRLVLHLSFSYSSPITQYSGSTDNDLCSCTTAKLLIWTAVCCGYLFVLMAHQHYSIDIIFGIVTPIWVWNQYHTLVVGCTCCCTVLCCTMLHWGRYTVPYCSLLCCAVLC